MLTENQRLSNMLGQRLYNMLGQRFYYMLGQRLYNMLGQRILDEQSADGFASCNQRLPNENCSLRPNVGPISTCYLGICSTVISYASFLLSFTFCHTCTLCHVELVAQFPAMGLTLVLLCPYLQWREVL